MKMTIRALATLILSTVLLGPPALAASCWQPGMTVTPGQIVANAGSTSDCPRAAPLTSLPNRTVVAIYNAPGTFTVNQAPGAAYIGFEMWGAGGAGGSGIQCGSGASCSGGGAGGGGAHFPSKIVAWADIGATSCSVTLGATATGGSGAVGGSAAITCNGRSWSVKGGGSGSNGQSGAASAGGGGGSFTNAGSSASGATGGAGGSPGGTAGVAGISTAALPPPYLGMGASGSSSTGATTVGQFSILAPTSGGGGGGCNAGTAQNGSNAPGNETSGGATHGNPGVSGAAATAWDSSGIGGGGGDAATGATNGGTGGAAGTGAGGGGGGDNCNAGAGTGGTGGNGGPATAIVWQG